LLCAGIICLVRPGVHLLLQLLQLLLLSHHTARHHHRTTFTWQRQRRHIRHVANGCMPLICTLGVKQTITEGVFVT